MRSFYCCALLLFLTISSASCFSQNDVVFHLFNRERPSQSIPMLADVITIMNSDFELGKKTVITVHNYGETASNNFNAHIIQAMLVNEDVNLIAVDWSPGCRQYTVGLSNAPTAGTFIANFIQVLNSNFGYGVDNIHIIGYGMGAHVAGIVGRNLQGTIPHITALDPSLVGWTHHDQKLDTDSAGYVEVLHTSAGTLGYDYPLGHVDFYANGGSYQTGCQLNVPDCSQSMSYVYLAEALIAEVTGDRQFVGVQCDSYEEAISLTCSNDSSAIFGNAAPATGVTGIYTFRTNFPAPYAQG